MIVMLLGREDKVEHRKLKTNQLSRLQLTERSFINVTSGRDVIAYLHIQKTGGSFFLAHLTTSQTINGRPICHLPSPKLRNTARRKKEFMVCPLDQNADTRNLSRVLPEMWLASERTYGWVCGVHPFLLEVKNCLNNYLVDVYGQKQRKYHLITILRHPVLRYMSEFLHVSRGATWSHKHICDGNTMEKYMPACYSGYYEGYPWKDLTFESFSSCSSNWANNRQTIMLSNLSTVHCLDKEAMSRSERNQLLLKTAKANLEDMPFFGLSEYFPESCLLFEKQFNVKFANPCTQKKVTHLHSSSMLYSIWTNRTLFSLIAHTNHLDMQLYDFAFGLFNSRLKKFNISIDRHKVDNEILNIYHSRRRPISLF